MKRILLLLALNAAAGTAPLLAATPASAQAEVTESELPVVSFTAYHSDLFPGVWLSWTAFKSIRVELFDEFGELHLKDQFVQGTYVVDPTRTTTYTLRAFNCDGNYVDKTITVTVDSERSKTLLSPDETADGDETSQED